MEPPAAPSDRLSVEEARARAGRLSNITYAIDLDLQAGSKSFRGDVTITFDHRGGDTFLEWVGGHVDRFQVNGVEMEASWDGCRVALPGAMLTARNEVRITYENWVY